MKTLKLFAWTIPSIFGLHVALAAIHDIVNGELSISGEITALVPLASVAFLVLGHRLVKRKVPA